MAAYFIWNGEDSRSKKILVRKLPDIIRPTQRTTEIIVPVEVVCFGQLMEGLTKLYDLVNVWP